MYTVCFLQLSLNILETEEGLPTSLTSLGLQAMIFMKIRILKFEIDLVSIVTGKLPGFRRRVCDKMNHLWFLWRWEMANDVSKKVVMYVLPCYIYCHLGQVLIYLPGKIQNWEVYEPKSVIFKQCQPQAMVYKNITTKRLLHKLTWKSASRLEWHFDDVGYQSLCIFNINCSIIA